MNYTQKLTLSMVVPTTMVGGAGATVVLGAQWLKSIAASESADVLAGYLGLGAVLTAVLTMACLLVCAGFAIWIRRTAKVVLGGEPSEAQRVLAELANGNLALAGQEVPAGSLMDSVQRLTGVMRSTLGDVSRSSQNVAVASGEIAAGNQDLSIRTEQAASYLQRIASSMEALTSTLRHSVEAGQEANQLAGTAAAVAERGGAIVSEVVRTMTDIDASSRRIQDIIAVIDGIAFQTNILALNAAVEAARAGEQGRGFAVVAAEVRALAGRSSAAAREIRDLITESVTKVGAGTGYVQEAGAAMQDIVGAVQRVGTVVHDITRNTSEQSQDVGTVNESIAGLDQMTQQNAALVEQSAAAAASLRDQARQLESVLQGFRF